VCISSFYHVTYKTLEDNNCLDKVFCLWLNTSCVEVNAEENHPSLKDKGPWCQNMWFPYIILQYIRKRIGDTEQTLHVHLSVPSQFDCISSDYVLCMDLCKHNDKLVVHVI
jgi:hypothetical protein